MELQDPLDREKLWEERRLRNKKKREDKKAVKLKETGNNTGKNNKGIAIVSPGFVNTFRNESKKPDVSKCKKNVPVTVDILDLVRADDTTMKPVLGEEKRVITGNRLDSCQPVRSTGKHREIPRNKKPSKYKRNLLPTHPESTTEKPHYINNTITEELTRLTENFVNEVVTLQEKLYKRDPVKGDLKRRYIVGFHETKKYLTVNKIKVLVIATDIKLVNYDDALHVTIKELCDLAESKSIPYVYALKRRKLGILTLKFIPVTCFAVLNYDGANEHYKLLIQEISRSKQLFEDQKCSDQSNEVSELLNRFKEVLV